MKSLRKYMFLLAAPVAMYASCTGGGEEPLPGSENYVFFDVKAVSFGSTSAVVESSYLADGQNNAVEVGIMYAEAGASDFTEVPAGGVSNQFVSVLSGLSPSTEYVARAYVRTLSGRLYPGTPTCVFTTKAGGGGEFDMEAVMGGVSAITSTGAVFSGYYAASGSGGDVTAVGFKYRRDGVSGWTSATAPGVSTSFSYTVSGLTAATKYYVRAWVEAGGVTYDSPEAEAVSFTTSGGGGSQTKAYLWGELPVLEEMDGVYYVTHYVTSNGESHAPPDTPGRIRNYTICYDESKRQPLWVACPMHSWYSTKNVERTNKWAYDPYIVRSAQPNLSLSYKPNGDGDFSRGHMVASSDRLRTTVLNNQTFYYTNMAPQTQNAFNGGIWEKLEKGVLAWGNAASDTVYVVTGSAFIGTLKTVKDNSDNIINVPSHFYKVLLSSKSGNTGKSISELSASELRCVGFWLSHYGHANNAPITREFMMSVSDIEELTGFSYFPMLSEQAKSVKNSYNPGDWGM